MGWGPEGEVGEIEELEGSGKDRVEELKEDGYTAW